MIGESPLELHVRLFSGREENDGVYGGRRGEGKGFASCVAEPEAGTVQSRRGLRWREAEMWLAG